MPLTGSPAYNHDGFTNDTTGATGCFPLR